MSKRVFIGIKMPNTIQREAFNWAKSLREKIHVRWISGENLHVTLIPPWEEDDIGKVAERMDSVSETLASFGIEFNRVSFGPGTGRKARLIWAMGRTPRALIDLRDELERKVFGSQSLKSLKLHLTLARFRPEHFSSFKVKSIDEKIVWGCKVDSVVLYKVHLNSGGAEYEVLHTVVL